MLIAWSRCSISEFGCNRKAKTRERRDTSLDHRSQRLCRICGGENFAPSRLPGTRAGAASQSPFSPRRARFGVRCRRPARHGLRAASDERHPLRLSCRGRLSPLGARSRRDLCRECRRHAQSDAGGAARRRRARGLYQQRRDARLAYAGASGDETIPLSEAEGIGTYKRSKIAAERLVEAMVARDRLPAVIVNPSTPIGPRDVRPTPTGRIIVEAARGRMPGFVDTGLNLVHVDDVADGHLAALRRGTVGERYILAGTECVACRHARRHRAFGRPACAAAAHSPRRRHSGRLRCPNHGALHRARPFATVDGLRMAKHHMFFTSAKAERELGFRARPYGEALADAIDWFREAGYLDGTRRHRDCGAAGLKLRASSMRIVVRDSQAYVAAEIEILHLSVREWFAGWGGCVPIGNDVNVAGVVGA